MTVVHKNRSGQVIVEELHNGDCMTQPAFHSAYEQMPAGFRAELVGGVVFVCEPLVRSMGAAMCDFHRYLMRIRHQHQACKCVTTLR